jgi:hypothetical protein
MRIVLAEDSVVFRKGLTRLLAEAGHQVVVVAGDAARCSTPSARRGPTWPSSTSGCRPR